jgi:hypothetical protein
VGVVASHGRQAYLESFWITRPVIPLDDLRSAAIVVDVDVVVDVLYVVWR